MQLQRREERCLKLFQGQIELVQKTIDLMDRVDPDWKDNKDDTAKLTQAMKSYLEDHIRRVEEIDRAKQNMVGLASLS